VLIGALMIHELRPGPELFTLHPLLVYTLFSSLLVANVILLGLGAFGSRLWVKVSLIPRRILYPFIFVFSMIGSYAVRSSLFDIGVCFGFGILGWLLNRYRYPVSPIVLGLVLGTMIETNLQMTLMMGGFSLFFTRPISAVLLLLSIVLVAWPFMADMRGRRTKSKEIENLQNKERKSVL
jgi:putative tricarboxylic transport membrane protein